MKTKYLSADFSATDIYEKLNTDLASMDIGILVNNVGMGMEHPEFYQNVSMDEIQRMININVVSMSMMTRMFFDVKLI